MTEMTEQRVSADELNKWLGTFGPSGPSAKPTCASNFALDLRDALAKIAALQSRIREADRIIDQAYRHCVMARETGDLAYAITTPLIEILTQPFLEREVATCKDSLQVEIQETHHE